MTAITRNIYTYVLGQQYPSPDFDIENSNAEYDALVGGDGVEMKDGSTTTYIPSHAIKGAVIYTEAETTECAGELTIVPDEDIIVREGHLYNGWEVISSYFPNGEHVNPLLGRGYKLLEFDGVPQPYVPVSGEGVYNGYVKAHAINPDDGLTYCGEAEITITVVPDTDPED